MLCDRNYLAFWCLGMINNLIFCVVISASDDIVNAFDAMSLVGLIAWANVALGMFSRLANTFLVNTVPVQRRIVATACFNATGLVTVACSNYVGSTGTAHFWFAILGIAICGCGSAFGESVHLGYLEKFPPHMVGAWSSGTGMSGVLGGLLYLAFRSAGLTFDTTFLILLVFVATYVWGAPSASTAKMRPLRRAVSTYSLSSERTSSW